MARHPVPNPKEEKRIKKYWELVYETMVQIFTMDAFRAREKIEALQRVVEKMAPKQRAFFFHREELNVAADLADIDRARREDRAVASAYNALAEKIYDLKPFKRT